MESVPPHLQEGWDLCQCYSFSQLCLKLHPIPHVVHIFFGDIPFLSTQHVTLLGTFPLLICLAY